MCHILNVLEINSINDFRLYNNACMKHGTKWQLFDILLKYQNKFMSMRAIHILILIYLRFLKFFLQKNLAFCWLSF